MDTRIRSYTARCPTMSSIRVGGRALSSSEMSAGMPRMLRYALNNRLFSEKMKAEADSESGGA